jgi:two-component system chemotaxis response regulator CheY
VIGGKRVRCLIVDDDIICRKSVLLALEEVFRCDEAADGREAVAMFTQALQKEDPYDVVLLDIIMPGINGHETAMDMRKVEGNLLGLEKTKIIMLTILDSANDAMKSFCYARSVAYMVKPVSEAKLISTFKEVGLL